jgi:hypothetical protein
LAYYAASVYLAAALVPKVQELIATTDNWNFVWTLAWVPSGFEAQVIEIMAVLAIVAGLFAVKLYHIFWARLAFFILFLMSASVPNSVGGINHAYHAWIFMSFIFLWLPNARPQDLGREGKMAFATIIRTAQATIFLFYSMAGLVKLAQGISALIVGQTGSLSVGALGYTLADRSLQTGTSPLLIDIVLVNPWIATVFMWGVIYVQCAALIVAFRPTLHVVWASALIAFHIGTWLFMEIIFSEHILLLVILFLLPYSKFAGVRRVLHTLPLFGTLFARLLPKKSERSDQGSRL